MSDLYRVKDWDSIYENNRTRDLKHLSWLPLPNRQDGDGYTELLDHPDGAAHFGAWTAIVQVASRCDPRGTLVRDGGRPHDSTSLSRMTRISKATFDAAIPRLISIGWLESEVVASDTDTTIPHEGAGKPHEGASPPHDAALNGMKELKEKKEGKSGGGRVNFFDSVEVPECLRTPTFLAAWARWSKHRRAKGKVTEETVLAQVEKCRVWGPVRAAKAIENSLAGGWLGIFESKEDQRQPQRYVDPDKADQIQREKKRQEQEERNKADAGRADVDKRTSELRALSDDELAEVKERVLSRMNEYSRRLYGNSDPFANEMWLVLLSNEMRAAAMADAGRAA